MKKEEKWRKDLQKRLDASEKLVEKGYRKYEADMRAWRSERNERSSRNKAKIEKRLQTTMSKAKEDKQREIQKFKRKAIAAAEDEFKKFRKQLA